MVLDDINQTFFVADTGLAFDDPDLVGESFNPALFDPITGDDPFDVVFFNSFGPPFASVSLFDVTDVTAEASATISIRYDFIAVPEPSSAFVGLIGLIAMAAQRRRA